MINHAQLLLTGHPGATLSSDHRFPKLRPPLLETCS